MPKDARLEKDTCLIGSNKLVAPRIEGGVSVAQVVLHDGA